MVSEYLQAVRRNWLTCIGVALVTMLAALGFSLSQKPTYQSTAVLYVSMDRVQSVTDLSAGAAYVLGQMKSYESVVISPQITQPVIADLKLGNTPDELAARIKTTTSTDSTVLEITCTADEAQQAADICNDVTAQFQKRIPGLATFEGKGMGTLKADVLTPASAPAVSANPSRSTVLGLGLVAALGLGIVAALFADRLRGNSSTQRGSITKDTQSSQR